MEIMEVSKRDMSVKAKKLRQMGLVPGHVFGGHLKQSVLLQIDRNTLQKMLQHKNIGSRLTLTMDGQKLPVQIKDKDVDSMTGQVRNISFQALAADQKVNSVVHIVLTNTDKVTAMIEFMLTELPYAALPQDMVDTVEINVDGMSVGTVITVGDLKELNNDKIELLTDKDEIVLRISDPRRHAGQNASEDAAAE